MCWRIFGHKEWINSIPTDVLSDLDYSNHDAAARKVFLGKLWTMEDKTTLGDVDGQKIYGIGKEH